jgi:FKBP-type peptidyl-prolyl cis-trans isomerase
MQNQNIVLPSSRKIFKQFKQMKFLRLTSVILLSVAVLSSCNKKEEKAELKSDVDSMSYSLGMNIAYNLKNQGPDTIALKAFIKGLEEQYAGKTAITLEKANEVIQNYFQKQQEAEAKPLIEEGEKFLNENKTKEGVVTTESGLQYKVIKEGTGATPKAEDVVTVHYKGTLLDGTVFDSSYDRNEPASFPVNGVIPGWTEALQLMKVGSKYQLFIPYHLGYGERGAGGQIKPYATLLFEVELISIGEPKKDEKKK